MLNVVPRLIKSLCPEGSGSGTLRGTVLFADIKGFSQLTEALKRKGGEGADLLSGIINSVYGSALDRVFKLDGSVVSFIGDSFIAVFPQDSESNLKELSEFIEREIPGRISQITNVNTGVRTGISKGHIDWGVIDMGGSASWYVRGQAVENACRAAYRDSDITVDSSVIKGSGMPVPRNLSRLRLGPSFSGRFVPRSIVSMKFGGEFRTTAPVFISFEGGIPRDRLHHMIRTVMKVAVVFGGYFAGVFFDEKGGSILVPFGVPRSRERAMDRALSFSLSVMEALNDCVSIGIAYGRVYAGFIGSSRRNSYTVLGDEVNNAARLSFIGEKGDILTTSDLENKLSTMSLPYKLYGSLKLKGREEPVRCLTVDKGDQGKPRISGTLVGREEELNMLRDFTASSFDSDDGTMLLFGPPGIGKSILTARLEESVSDQCRVLRIEAFEMDYSSIAPLERLLGRILGVSLHMADRETLESSWSGFQADKVKSGENSPGDELTKGMVMWIAGQGPPPPGGTEPSRIAGEFGTIMGFWRGNLPVLLIAEDAQWMTGEVIRVLKHLGDMDGISVLMTSRQNPENTGIQLGKSLGLFPLSRREIEHLLRNRSDKIPDQEMIDIIMERSSGNPFTALQFYDLLEESRSAVTDGSMAGSRPLEGLPDEIAEVLTARIDRMDQRLRNGILSISVLGNRFTLPVFSRIVGNDYETVLRDGIQAEIWQSQGDDEFAFSHALLQQAASSISLGAKLRNLHNRAFKALENVFPDDPSKAHGKAFQLEKAGRLSKAAEFYESAGDYFGGRYLNNEAIDCFRAMERCLPESDVYRRLEARGKLCRWLESVGEWEESMNVYHESIEMAKRSGQRLHEGRLLLSLGKLQLNRGMLQQGKATLDESLSIFNQLGDEDMISRVHSNLAVYHYFSGNFESAEEYVDKFLRTSLKLGMRDHEAMAYGFLAVIFQDRDELQKALDISRRQLEIADELGLLECKVDAYTNIGTIFSKMDELEKAQDFYNKAMTVVETSGLYADRMSLLGRLASLEHRKGNLDEAQSNYEEALKMARRLQDSYNEAYYLLEIANIRFQKRESFEARMMADSALEIIEEFGYKDLMEKHGELTEMLERT